MNNNSSGGSSSSGQQHQQQQAHDPNITPAALLEQLVYVDTFMPEIDDPTHLDDRLSAELAAFVGDSFVFPDEDKPKMPKDDEDDKKDAQNTNNQDNQNNTSDNNPAFNSNSLYSQLGNNSFGLPTNNLSGLSQPSATSSLSLLNQINNSTNSNNISSLLTPNVNFNSLTQASLPTTTPATAAPTDILSSLPKVPVPPGAKSALLSAGLSTTQIDALAALIAQHEHSKNATAVTNLATSFTTPSLPLGQQSGNPLLGHSNNNNTDNNNHYASSSASSSRNNSVDTLPPIKTESTGDPELDKRKRNTAASARFRIKKKLKEQQLERSVRELTELTMTLEKKIQTLEMENRLLRNLVVEKGEQRNNNEVEMMKQRARMASEADFSHAVNGSSSFGGR